MSQIKITEGRTLRDPDADEVIMGKVASENHGKGVGDTIRIKNRDYRIVAYSSQEICSRTQGHSSHSGNSRRSRIRRARSP